MKWLAFPSFPNSIWERLVLPEKFHFALMYGGNEIAPTCAFPNEIWEREKRGSGNGGARTGVFLSVWERGEARNAKGVAILKRRVGAAAPTLEKSKSKVFNPERVESAGPITTINFEENDSTLSGLVSSKGTTRVGAARQPFALLWQRLWRCSRGNGVAQTSAFPNGVWERGIVVLAFLLVLGLRSVAADDASPDSVLVTGEVTSADMHYFFDSISYDHSKWRFELSRNAMGMIWRMNNGDDDVSGVCTYTQTLVVPRSSIFDLKTRDFEIRFEPTHPAPFDDGRPQFIVWKRYGGHKYFSLGGNTILEITKAGKWAVGHGED